MKTGNNLILAALVLVCLSIDGFAGSTNGGEPNFAAEDIVALARNLSNTLAAEGVRVALISRVGRDPDVLPDGVRYTHVAFAVYSQIETTDGRTIPGYAVYNLYQDRDNPQTSSLVEDFPIDYFAAIYALRSEVIIPNFELQQRLLEVIQSERYAQLHNPHYSALSNPFDTRYQNCTEFVLNVLQAAIYDTGDLEQIKINTRTYFEPQRIRIGGFKLLLARLFKPDVKFGDHVGPIRTTTLSSLARYMEKYELATRIVTITNDQPRPHGSEL